MRLLIFNQAPRAPEQGRVSWAPGDKQADVKESCQAFPGLQPLGEVLRIATE